MPALKGRNMIRPTIPEDTPALVAMTEGTGLFQPLDLEALNSVLAEYHAGTGHGHHCVTYEQKGQVIGFAYYAPAAMTDRTWHLWWIVVSKQIQARGIGGQLLHHAEEGARAERGRLMIVETSGLPSYDLTRRFYLKQHYELAATLKDFYADGHDMVIFSKRLIPAHVSGA
jgi:ribosomal protein S18 acetylase RimI-like enzyme